MGTSRFASINARPQPVEFDIAKTAVIVVDMQNDFGSPHGMFGRAGIDLTGIRGTIAPTARVLAAAHGAGVMVVYLKMAFRPDLSDAGAPNSPNWLKHRHMHAGEAMTAPDGTPSRILIRDTWNTEIIDELAPEPSDVVVYKHRFSGFFETDLDAILRRNGIENLVFTGCTTSVCVESTLKDAMFRDYHCVLLEDCTAEAIGAGSPRTNHEATVLVIELLVGSVSNAQEFCRALNASASSDLAHSS
jgi:ureidoacrylate peracid hydrolase